jgi:agmatinase
MVSVIGIPLDENSSYLSGAALAPRKIMEAYHSESSNYCAENGNDLSKDNRWKDLGDLTLSPMTRAFDEIEKAITTQLSKNKKVLSLGGDHSMTYPVIKAFGKKYDNLTILHFDAHSDLYDNFEGNTLSHACPFARIMENKLAKRLVQVGIRTLTPHTRDQAKRFSVEIYEMKDWNDSVTFKFDGPVYVSLDLDALDPAYAPGISHYEPGGLSVRQILRVMQTLEGNLVGADIVELNPNRDVHDRTAMVAAKFLKELLVKLLQ